MHILEAQGYEMVEARSAEEGLQVFREVGPDLVIVDLMMEEVDSGTSFVKELKVAGAGIPVYMLSSVGDNLSMTVDPVRDTPETRARFLSTIPIGRFSTPEDMGHAAVYLCSDEASMVTGVTMEVDGGRCI